MSDQAHHHMPGMAPSSPEHPALLNMTQLAEGAHKHIQRNIEGDVQLRPLLMLFWRQRVLIVAAMLVGLCLCVAALQVIKPLYAARAVILIEAPSATVTSLKGAGGGSPVLDELEIIRSRSFLAKVIARLKRPQSIGYDSGASDSYFDLGTKPAGFKALSVYGSQLKLLSAETVDPDLIEAVSAFQEDLRARMLPGSSAIQVEFTAQDATRSAAIVNMLVDTYLADHAARRVRDKAQLKGSLDERITELRGLLNAKEQAVQSHKKRSVLSAETTLAVNEDQLSLVYNQLAQARLDRAALEARLSYLRDVEQGAALPENAPEILRSDAVRALSTDVIRLEGVISELSKRYGDKHPRMIKARAELSNLNRSIYSEMDKVEQAARADLALAQAHIASLEASLDTVKNQLYESDDSVVLPTLEREAESIKTALEALVQTYALADQQSLVQALKVRVLSQAVVPSSAFYPNKKLVLSLGMLISLFIGLCAALLIEKMDNTLRSAAQLERSFGYRCLGLVPQVKPTAPPPYVADYILKNPSSIVSEAVRNLRMMLKLKVRNGADASKSKVVALTSSQPGEGKTTLSLWRARLAAKSGERVLVIDADLRRPNVHKSVAARNDDSLVEYLTGHKSLQEIIHKDRHSGADMIYAASVPGRALDLISCDKMAALIDDMRGEYDLIIIDTPACLAAPDARVIAHLADQTLYTVAWNRTSIEMVGAGVKQFQEIGHKSLSFVLSNVDVKKHVRYGYGDTVYYYGRYEG